MVSPVAQRLFDLAAGHCSVNVLLQTFCASRENCPDDSTPVIKLETTFEEISEPGMRGEALSAWESSGVSEEIDVTEGNMVFGVMVGLEEDREEVDVKPWS